VAKCHNILVVSDGSSNGPTLFPLVTGKSVPWQGSCIHVFPKVQEKVFPKTAVREPDKNQEVNMAREQASLARGDVFPELELGLATGERIVFPGESGGKWTALLFYCDSGCPKCLEQLKSFRRVAREGRRENMRTLVISGEDRERTVRTMWDLQIPFSIAYLEDPGRAANGLGGVYDREREDMHPKVYLVDPDGKIADVLRGDVTADWFRHTGQFTNESPEARDGGNESDSRYAIGGPVRGTPFVAPDPARIRAGAFRISVK
jgi:peroxiredoxin